MASLAQILNNTSVSLFPYDFATLETENPHSKFKNTDVLNLFPLTEMATQGYTVIRPIPTATPIAPEGQRAVEVAPEKVGDHWEQRWVLESLSGDDLIMDQVSHDKQAAKLNTQLQALIDARPNQIETYIDNNVVDLASAKDILKILAKAVAVLGRRELKS